MIEVWLRPMQWLVAAVLAAWSWDCILGHESAGGNEVGVAMEGTDGGWLAALGSFWQSADRRSLTTAVVFIWQAHSVRPGVTNRRNTRSTATFSTGRKNTLKRLNKQLQRDGRMINHLYGVFSECRESEAILYAHIQMLHAIATRHASELRSLGRPVERGAVVAGSAAAGEHYQRVRGADRRAIGGACSRSEQFHHQGGQAAVRVLLVEDNTLTRKLLAELLTARDHTIHEAGRVETALDILERHAVNVLVTNMVLPGCP